VLDVNHPHLEKIEMSQHDEPHQHIHSESMLNAEERAYEVKSI
jgi:hypothetical protein